MAEQLLGESVSDSIAIFLELVKWVTQFFVVFGGILPYIPQYWTIRRTKDAEGFSTFVCFVLLVASILRILFWFGKHYELPLLLQSIFLTGVMLAMLHICTQVNLEKKVVIRRLTDFDLEYFWRWSYFSDYCLFTVFLSLVGGISTFFFVEVNIYIEVLGFASLLMEACLGFPQFWRNYTNKSTEGMSVQMVLLWFLGDTSKTVYFILRLSPMQFLICGILQCVVDVAILGQVFVYRTTSQPSKA